MKDHFLLRHGIRMAAVAAFGALTLFTVITVLSYRGDKRLIDLWESYMLSEEQLFLLREDANRLFEVEHRLLSGGVNLDSELKKAGTELSRIPSLEIHARRHLSLLHEARAHLMRNRDARARAILQGPAINLVSKELREALFKYELNERNRLQQKLMTRLDSQEEILETDVAGIIMAVVLCISAFVLMRLYMIRQGNYDRELVAARHEAERASRLKSSFLANMSHEIRTPLNGVLGLTRLLRETKLDSEQQEIIESLEASGRTLLSIVNDILDLSKIESGKIEVEEIDYNLSAVLADIEKVFRATADRKQIKFVVQGPSQALFVRGDTVKVRQVLQNLVSNALKFTRNGEVRTSWRIENLPRGLFMRFEVRDTGIGIPSEALHRIFHPFEQADTSTSRHYGGSGLGLAICRHLVEAMGGEIGVDSKVGFGSLFWFRVPYVSVATPPLEDEVLSQPLLSNAALKDSSLVGPVLLVEDNEVNQHLVASFLRRRGYQLETAFNGIEALDWLKKRPFQLILMDAHLPEMDGFEATRRIRAGEAGPLGRVVPIIALTASAITGERERCLAVGMNDFMTKPVDLDLLERNIRRMLRKKGDGMESQTMKDTKKPLPYDLDEDLYLQLIAIFRRVTPDRIRDFEQAKAKQDWTAAGKIAHTIKSSAAQLGLTELAEICKKMEVKGLSGEGDEDWETMSAEFHRRMEKCLNELPAGATT
ncbi:MAG: response regulator [Bdellovibrionaceae bacterium]|nr:response regulator [Pseudobdellovibrionaceae bacterium]MBX3035227.1 response regulator [Pseudobdellovibrionaceae bacterium]